MTTIAYRDGVIAGDGRETAGEDGYSTIIIRDNAIKVYTLPDGRLFGGSRTSEDIAILYDALKDGVVKWPSPELGDINALCIDTDGKIYFYEGNKWEHVDTEYYSVGSGSVFAFAAMDAGASAVEAVEVGKKRDPFSGGAVHSEVLKRA